MSTDLYVYNSFTRQKEKFVPLTPGQVSIYVCGITVYDDCHIGHARLMIAFDIITRFLRARGFKVNYTRNITDIDDKIIKRALENNEDINSLTTRYIKVMREDEQALHILPPGQEPRATEHIKEIIELVERLLANDVAYVTANGDVNYRVKSFTEYGQLAKRDLDGMRAGERVAINDDKEDPLDFVLWKKAKAGEPSWPSSWGEGRPGWHIECSAMARACLGEQFDMHGGGLDLIFPHHENEIAQSKAAGCAFANYWLHNGLVRVNDEKMSKSLHNFLTIREALSTHAAEVIRYLLVASHYRSHINFNDDALLQSRRALTRLYLALRDVEFSRAPVQNAEVEQFMAAMNDDFNTPEALGVIFDVAHRLQTAKQMGDAPVISELANTMAYLADILGLLQASPDEFLQQSQSTSTLALSNDDIEALIAKRQQARVDKDWAMSDQIRDQLQAAGIVLEDSASGTTWRRD